MKKLTTLLSLVALVLIACSGGGSDGAPGAPGPQGPPGEDGLIGTVFEVEVDFTSANGWEVLVEIPLEIEVFDTDVIVAYLLSDVEDGVDVWEPMPQLIFFGTDTLFTGFNYTFNDVLFFLDGTVDLAALDPVYTTALVFRVAIIPADFAQKLDTTSLPEVMSALQVQSVSRLE